MRTPGCSSISSPVRDGAATPSGRPSHPRRTAKQRARTSRPKAISSVVKRRLLSAWGTRGCHPRRSFAAVVVVSVQGPGGDLREKSRSTGCDPAAQATEPFLECPARARCSAGRDVLGVGDQVAPHDVAEPTLERTDRLAWGLAFGELAVVVGAAGAVSMTDLDDRRAMQGVVEPPVATPDSRWVTRPPEENSIGAVPVEAA